MANRALIVVDVQRDFCAGGALAASDTHSLLAPLHTCIETARRAGVAIIYTRDWHPKNHSSFTLHAGPWPVHCVADTLGAELMPPLTVLPGDIMIHKGMSKEGQGYSGFDATELNGELRKLKIAQVAVCGIATEYCVRATVLEAVKAGFETEGLTDLIRAVKVHEAEKILLELHQRGARSVESAAWCKEL